MQAAALLCKRNYPDKQEEEDCEEARVLSVK